MFKNTYYSWRRLIQSKLGGNVGLIVNKSQKDIILEEQAKALQKKKIISIWNSLVFLLVGAEWFFQKSVWICFSRHLVREE
jgi:hypothetical protein